MRRAFPSIQFRFVLAFLVGVSIAFQVAWLSLHWGSSSQAVWYADLSYLAVIYSSFLLGLQTFLRAPRSQRMAVGLLASALLALGAGESIWVFFALFTQVSPDASAADLCYYCFYLLLGLSLLRQANWVLRSVRTIGLLLDSVIIVGVMGLYAWFLFLARIGLDPERPVLLRLVSLSYPVLDLGLLVLMLLVLGRKRMTLFASLVSGGVTLYIAGDLIYAFLSSTQAYVAGTWTDLLWTSGTTVLALGGAISLFPGTQNIQEWVMPAWMQRALAVLPYLAGVSSGALLIFCVQHPSSATPGVVWGTVLLFGLVLIRQVLSLQENARLTQALLTSARHLEQSHALLTHQAFHDVLTGLPNRALWRDRLEQALASRRPQHLSVLCIDLDGFKLVNDRFGHAAGDAVLVEAARRMKQALREGDTLARMGGDEFTALLCGMDEPQNAEGVARRMILALAQPFEGGTEKIHVTASIGISPVAQGERDTDLLQHQADLALYQAKAEGKNGFHTFTAALQQTARTQEVIRRELEHALERGELELHYQPQFRAQQVTGMEALLRWNSSLLGSVPPDQFIPVAEDTGLILLIDRWVMNQACKQASAWHASGMSLRVAVNVSPLQFAQPEFLAQVTACLTRHQLPGQLLELELTERLVVRDLQMAGTTIKALQQLGVSVALDDFGSGSSSISHLMTLPISCVKIDRQFVLNAEQSPGGHGVIQAITALARTLNLQVVAEGIETHAQWTMVSSLGCDVVQGYLLGRPMSADQANLWLGERHREVGITTA